MILIHTLRYQEGPCSCLEAQQQLLSAVPAPLFYLLTHIGTVAA
jgi:hypothetical protein